VESDKTALPDEYFERQRMAAGQPPEKGIYTAAVVVMLVILQRLLQVQSDAEWGGAAGPERTAPRDRAQAEADSRGHFEPDGIVEP
jgi:hypothetical protein